MFRVIFSNDQKFGMYRVVATVTTVEEARFARQVSGDVVVDALGAIVTKDTFWLHPDLPESYAKRLIAWQKEHPHEPYLQSLRQTEIK